VRAQFSRELGLTPAQDSAFDAIMMERAGEFSALREEIRPRVERLVSDVRSDMEQVLTPEQRERFRKLQTRRDDAERMSSSAP
jgi:Spy/CpxP family protein refolding chaperone